MTVEEALEIEQMVVYHPEMVADGLETLAAELNRPHQRLLRMLEKHRLSFTVHQTHGCATDSIPRTQLYVRKDSAVEPVRLAESDGIQTLDEAAQKALDELEGS